MTAPTAKGRPAATERPFTPPSRGNGSTTNVPTPSKEHENMTILPRETSEAACLRIAAALRAAAVAHVLEAAGVDPHALDDDEAPNLLTSEIARITAVIGVRPSEIAARAGA